MKIDPQKAADDIVDVLNFDPGYGGSAAVTELAALYQACVDRWAPPGSSYRRMADSVDTFGDPSEGHYLKLQAVLKVMERDYRKGVVATFEELVHAAMFDDLLAQASYLLGESYSLPAAVIAGATLEEHLRKLASRHAIPLETGNAQGRTRSKTASVLNDNLHTAKAITQPEWRQNQISIDIRNEAAHGKQEFQARTAKDIERMIDDVRQFVIRYPA